VTDRSILARVLVLAAALMAPACGGEGGGLPTTPRPTAVLTVVASPNPVVGGLCGAHCGNLPGEREALTDLTIRETAGVGVNLTGGSQELRNTSTGAVIAMMTLVASDFVRDTGTSRVAASGQLVYHAAVHYPAAHAGVPAAFTFVIQGTDDNGHAVSVTLIVPTTG
jgi:hypothetical protein